MRFVVRNLAGNYTVYALSIVAGLILTPVIVHAVGHAGYGAWAVIGSITVFLRILDFGLGPALTRFSAYYRSRDEHDSLNELASCGLALYAVISVLALAVGVVVAWFLPELISLHGNLALAAQVATLVMVLSLAVELPLSLFSSLLKGSQRFDIINVGAVISLSVYAVLVLVILREHGSIAVLAAITLVVTAVRVALPAAVVRREFPALRLSRELVSRSRLRSLGFFSGYTSLGQIAAKIVFSSDVIVIGVVLGAAAAAIYAVASRLFSVAQGVAGTGTDLLFPAISAFEGRGEKERQQRYLLAGLRASGCVVVLVVAPLVMLPGWVLRGWLGAGFQASSPALVLLALTLLFTQPTSLMAQYLIARGKPQALAVVQLAFGLMNLGATVFLLVGVGKVWVAPLATLVLEGLVTTVVLPMLLIRDGVTYLGLATSWLRSLGAAVIPAAVVLVPAAFIWHGSDSLLGVLAVCAVWAVAFAPAAWFAGLRRSDRDQVRQLLRRKGIRPGAAPAV